MILGIGSDIVEIARIFKAIEKFGDKFLTKIFTSNEIIAAQNKSFKKNAFYAKRFAAKEAFSKACGTGIGRGINFNDIEVFNDDFGKPKIKILNNKNSVLQKLFGCKNFAIHLSISDEKSLAQAFVIIEKLP